MKSRLILVFIVLHIFGNICLSHPIFSIYYLLLFKNLKNVQLYFEGVLKSNIRFYSVHTKIHSQFTFFMTRLSFIIFFYQVTNSHPLTILKFQCPSIFFITWKCFVIKEIRRKYIQLMDYLLGIMGKQRLKQPILFNKLGIVKYKHTSRINI